MLADSSPTAAFSLTLLSYLACGERLSEKESLLYVMAGQPPKVHVMQAPTFASLIPPPIFLHLFQNVKPYVIE